MSEDDDFFGLNDILERIGGLANITVEQQRDINNEAADVLVQKLHEVTKEKHYTDDKSGKVTHLADAFSKGVLEDDVPDGDIAVGIPNNDIKKVLIARWLNDGTKYIKGDSFIDKTIEETKNNVLDIQEQRLNDLLDGKEKEVK